MGFFKRLFRIKQHTWVDPKIAKEASDRAAEINKLRHEQRVLEYQRNLLRERWKNEQLRDEISFYQNEKNMPSAEEDQAAQLQGLLALMQIFAAPGGQNEQAGIAQLMQYFTPGQQIKNQFPLSDKGGSPLDTQQLNENLPPEASEFGLSDEEIRAEISKIPRQKLALARALNPKIIKAYLKKNFPYDDRTIERAIQIMKAEQVAP